jgi:hypothetical protein
VFPVLAVQWQAVILHFKVIAFFLSKNKAFSEDPFSSFDKDWLLSLLDVAGMNTSPAL